MNPDSSPYVKLSMGWGRPASRNLGAERAEAERRSNLHARAVARRRKAKRGGKR